MKRTAWIFVVGLTGIIVGTGWWWQRANEEQASVRQLQREREENPGREYAMEFLRASDIEVLEQPDAGGQVERYSVKATVMNRGARPVASVRLRLRLPNGWRSDVSGMQEKVYLFFAVGIPPGKSLELSETFAPVFVGKDEQRSPITAESIEFEFVDCTLSKSSG